MDKRGERIERVVDIYESTDTFRARETDRWAKDAEPERKTQPQHTESRCWRLSVVCLVLLCALLLVAALLLWFKFNININIKTSEYEQLQTKYDNLTVERDQLQKRYDNLTVERDQLQKRYDNLTVERDQLQMRYDNLTLERDQLQMRYDNLTVERGQLQMRYDNLTVERDQLQMRYDNLTVERDQLQMRYDNLTVERDQLQKERNYLKEWISNLTQNFPASDGWVYFGSSFYKVSTEKKNWNQSREDCKMRGTNLVIVNSAKEQDFVQKFHKPSDHLDWIWIGLSDSEKEGTWKWVDGSPLGSWSIWGPNQPNNLTDDGKAENCVAVINDWHDHYCLYQYRWICEKTIAPN